MATGMGLAMTSQGAGAAAPAAAGSGIGGALAGAGILAGAGTLQAILANRAQRKAQQRQLAAQAQMNIGQIHQQTAQQKNVALSNIMEALRGALV